MQCEAFCWSLESQKKVKKESKKVKKNRKSQKKAERSSFFQ